MLEFFVKITFANNPSKIVTNQREFEKAATWITFEILFVGVPLSKNKSRKNPAQMMATLKIKWRNSSITEYDSWLMPTIANDEIIAIIAEVLYEDGFNSVKYHLLWISVTLSSLIN